MIHCEVCDKLSSVNKIRERMYDEESVFLYDARIRYLIYKDFYDYAMSVLTLDHEWKIPQIDSHGNENQYREIIVWGYCSEAEYIIALLKKSIYKNCDIYICEPQRILSSDETLGCNIILPEEIKQHPGALIIPAAKAEYTKILSQIGNMLFTTKDVIIPEDLYRNHLYGITGVQYFDFWKAGRNEVFVDVGSLNGLTVVDFKKWCDDSYDGVYVFEPNLNMEKICRETLKSNQIHDVHFFRKAAWNKQERLSFRAEEGMYPGGSRVTVAESNIYVEGDCIDNCLSGERVTFIKMDIEGSEFNALLGCRETIKKWKPRLAISLYHKPEDIVEIPFIILDICPEYKFAIRQYASNMNETVLYCFI